MSDDITLDEEALARLKIQQPDIDWDKEKAEYEEYMARWNRTYDETGRLRPSALIGYTESPTTTEGTDGNNDTQEASGDARAHTTRKFGWLRPLAQLRAARRR